MPTLLSVVAHPDDDAYGIAGTVALHASEPDFRFGLVHATDGEGGDIRQGFDATPATLGRIRRAKDEAGWRAVGRPPDRHVWLGFPRRSRGRRLGQGGHRRHLGGHGRRAT